MMIISQNKEKILWTGGMVTALEYAGQTESRENKRIRHTVCVSGEGHGEIAEYTDYAAQTTRPGLTRNNTVYEMPEE